MLIAILFTSWNVIAIDAAAKRKLKDKKAQAPISTSSQPAKPSSNVTAKPISDLFKRKRQPAELSQYTEAQLQYACSNAWNACAADCATAVTANSLFQELQQCLNNCNQIKSDCP